MALGIADIEVVEHEDAAGFQGARDVVDNGDVVRRIVEIAKAREQVDDVVEDLVAEGKPHILPSEPQIRGFELLCPPDAFRGQIDAADAKASCVQVSGMASGATTKVEDRCTRRRPQPRGQLIDEAGSFLVVAVRVQSLIMRRVEPRCEPLRFGAMSNGCLSRLHRTLTSKDVVYRLPKRE